MSTWKTSNQNYGSHSGRPSSLPSKKIGRSTLEYIEKLDKGDFIHQQQNISKRERHGLFTQPLGLAPGDVYKDPQQDKPSKRVEVNQKMQQKVGPELFSKLSSTNLGDPYKDPFRANQLYIKEKTDLSMHPTAFAAGGRQKLVKHSEFEHQKQFDDKVYNTRDANGKVVTGLKKMYTNNMKKGFGATGTQHLFSSYPYMGYPDDEARQLDSNGRLIHKAKIPTPFKASNPTQTFTPDYALYNSQEPYQQKKEDDTFRKSAGGPVWKTNNPNKKGYNGTFTAFPQYIEEGQKEKASKKDEKIWIPNFNGTSKGLGETLSRPCPPPSQMVVNEMRRMKP